MNDDLTPPTPPLGEHMTALNDLPGYQPPNSHQIRSYLGNNSTSSNHLSISINTTSAQAAGMAGDMLVALIADVLALDQGADIDFESAVTSRTHYDTNPF